MATVNRQRRREVTVSVSELPYTDARVLDLRCHRWRRIQIGRHKLAAHGLFANAVLLGIVGD